MSKILDTIVIFLVEPIYIYTSYTFKNLLHFTIKWVVRIKSFQKIILIFIRIKWIILTLNFWTKLIKMKTWYMIYETKRKKKKENIFLSFYIFSIHRSLFFLLLLFMTLTFSRTDKMNWIWLVTTKIITYNSYKTHVLYIIIFNCI